MNRVILIGRLTRDVEAKTTQSGNTVASFTLAVDRRFKSANGERQADFINCTAWRQTAEFIARYFAKGARIAVVGSIQTSSWDDSEGKKQYKTEVVVEEAYFTESKSSGDSQQVHQTAQQKPRTQQQSMDDFVPVDDDTMLPFDV